MGGACSAYVGEERCIKVLVGKPEGRTTLGYRVWSGLIWLRVVNAVITFGFYKMRGIS